MKKIKSLFSLLLALVLCVSVSAAAFAEGEAEGAVSSAVDFASKSWDEIIADFVASYDLQDWQLMLGYYNLVTGEEHYLNPDVYTDAASTYKVPLNMLYAERIARGEMELDSNIWAYKYSDLLHSTIVDSNNEHAEVLWTYIGGYSQYRHMIAEYMGEDPDTVDGKFYVNNYITARQATTCLRTLYDNPDRFPYIIDTMKQAEPDNYFRAEEKRFEIAHKYGYNSEGFHYYINDTAIVYTDDPIAIVFYSDNVAQGLDVMAKYCTLMCDYAQYHTAERLSQERAEAENAVEEAEEPAVEVTQPDAEAVQTDTTSHEEEDMITKLDFPMIIMLILAFAAAVAVLVLVIANHRKIGIFWGFITAVLLFVTLTVCLAGTKLGTLLTITEGNPTETVTSFFDAVVLGDYSSAYDCLEAYTSLGLENTPNNEAAALLRGALIQSYSYQLVGETETEGLSARQSVEFGYLDLSAIDARIQAMTPEKLEQLVEERPISEIYDEEHNYLPEITNEAYLNALKDVLSHSDECKTTVTLELKLNYINETWLISADTSLLRALLGGISY